MQRLTEKDKRNLIRKPLDGLINIEITNGSKKISGHILNGHPKGFLIEVDSNENFNTKDWTTGKCYLYFEGIGKFSIKIHPRDNSNKVNIIGVSIDTADDSFSFSFSSEELSENWDIIREVSEINSIIKDVTNTSLDLKIICKQKKTVGVFLFDRYSEKKEFILNDQFNSNILEGSWKKNKPIYLCFNLFESSYIFKGTLQDIKKNKLFIKPFTDNIIRLLRRNVQRSFLEDNSFMVVSFKNPINKKEDFTFSVVDVSEKGLSLKDVKSNFYIPIGTHISEIKIKSENINIFCSAKIVSVRRERNYHCIGVEISISSVEERRKWHNIVLKLRYPQLGFQYLDDDHSKIWDLFDRSGYLISTDDEGAEANFKEMESVTKRAWGLLEESGTKNSRRFLQRKNDEVIGHLQMDRYYPNTWAVHHLAIDKKASKLVAKEMYGAVTDVLNTEGADYLISYHRPDLAWNQKNYYNFVERYPFKKHHDIQHFYLHYVNFDVADLLSESNGVTFSIANEWDIRRIRRFFELNSSEMERKALSLNEDLELGNLNGNLKAFGLERWRKFIVASRGKELLAFLRVEVGSHGVNIVRLFDTAFYHPVNVQKVESDAILLGLLNQAKGVYLSKNRRRVLLPLKESDCFKCIPKGIIKACYESRWIANCSATKRYHAYSSTLFGRLLARRNKRKVIK